MNWKEQFEIIKKIIAERLVAEGEKYTLANAAGLLGVKVPKLQAWGKGQRPSVDDIEVMVRTLGISAEWILLGKGAPTNTKGSGKFVPDFVYICDTLHDLIHQLPGNKLEIAKAGGISIDDLDEYTSSLALPSALTIANWIHAYRINANFLLAQVGQPFLTDDEYEEKGPLTWVREKRGDFTEDEVEEETNEGDAPSAFVQDILALEAALRRADATNETIQRAILAKVGASESPTAVQEKK